jgi:GNAT superfamily N-acetyltransferase
MIKEITYQECLTLWNLLWADRVSPIEPCSAMDLPPNLPWDCVERPHTTNYGQPTFLGAFRDGELVGVNSLHHVNGRIRSRGLYVLGSHRGHGIAKDLLLETITRADGLEVWSFPKKEALMVYIRAGFFQVSPMMWDHKENKNNCYVTTKPKPHYQPILPDITGGSGKSISDFSLLQH